MKNIIIFFALALLCLDTFAQADTSKIPQFVQFQAVARAANGDLIINHDVQVRFVIYNSVTGDTLWCETYQETTNDYGSFAIAINNHPNVVTTNDCNPTIGFFEDIPWETGDKWMKIYLIDTIGNPPVEISDMELSSSFYSLASEFAERIPHWYFEGGDSIAHNGAVNIYGDCLAFSFLTPSDERYKENIETIPNALASLENIQGVYYYYKQDEFPDKKFSDRRQIGVIAQDVEKVYPELVTTNPDGYKSVDYTKLAPILLQAIKEQEVLMQELKAEQDSQNQDIETLKAEQNSTLRKLQELQAILDKDGILTDSKAEK